MPSGRPTTTTPTTSLSKLQGRYLLANSTALVDYDDESSYASEANAGGNEEGPRGP